MDRPLAAVERRPFPMLACILILTFISEAFGASIVVNNLDAGSGLGFDDPTPVAPVPGNPATTLGQQRLNAFQAAAAQWAAILDSSVTIEVNARMPAQQCSQFLGTLGSAAPETAHRNFTSNPRALPDTWYPQALANSLAGVDLSPASDISADFNRSIDDDPNCLTGVVWSYVIGAPNPPGTLAFTETVLHEIGHGIGVAGFTNLAQGSLLFGAADHYANRLYSEAFAAFWVSLTDQQRVQAASDNGNLTWNGPAVQQVADFLSSGRRNGRVRMYAPDELSLGSSVNHFDTVLTPDELMEPFSTASSEQLLTNHLLLDVGWSLRASAPISVSDGLTQAVAGSPTNYAIMVENQGPGDIRLVGATVTASIANLQAVTWTCSGTGGGQCLSGNSGAGLITDLPISVPLGASVTIDLEGTIHPAFSGSLQAGVTLTMPDNIGNTANGSATDSTLVLPLNSPPGILVSEASGNTTETGVQATFAIAALTPPAGPVTVALSSSDTSEGTVPASVLLPAGSTTAQIVTVTGVDDALVDGDRPYTVLTLGTTSSDGDYDGLDPADVALVNEDDDFVLGGVATGLPIAGLTLQNNGADDLSITSDGPFAFPTPLKDGSSYLVSISDPPDEPGITCSVTNASGIVSGANVNNVFVQCASSCNVLAVSGVTIASTTRQEACELLIIGPDFLAEDGADVTLSSGERIQFLPGFWVEQGATLDAEVCGQSLCEISPTPMPVGCHSCVTDICAVDSFCCSFSFDEVCVGAVQSVCGLTCE